MKGDRWIIDEVCGDITLEYIIYYNIENRERKDNRWTGIYYDKGRDSERREWRESYKIYYNREIKRERDGESKYNVSRE